MRDISNSADIIDSRDVIERHAELFDEREYLSADVDEAEAAWLDAGGDVWDDARTALRDTLDAARAALQAWDDDNKDEFDSLTSLIDEGESLEDWEHGATLIRDDYFEDYARELADDLGLINKSDNWPYTCIDWKKAARDLRVDYTSIDFDGVTYWARA